MKTSVDRLMNGAIMLEQPEEGYRVAIDPVFLAAFVPANPGETVLDVGCGVGAAMLCLAHRIPDIRITGLELQSDYARLATCNIRANNRQHNLDVITGDLLAPPPRLVAGTFHHVMTNPPYFNHNQSTPSDNKSKSIATIEKNVSFQQWIDFCLLMVQPGGVLSLIFPAGRLDEILFAVNGKAGDISVFPLWPGRNKPARRLLVRARKQSRGVLNIYPGLELHGNEGKYSQEAEQILRFCQPLLLPGQDTPKTIARE